jgi:pimeloyl-ACP methyl ester carboxylesterase
MSERVLEFDGAPIRCLESGSGESVVAVHGPGDGTPTPLETLLAQKFRVLALESTGFVTRTPEDAGRLLGDVIAKLGLGRYAVIAAGRCAGAALSHAAAASPQTLVLISPAGAVPEARLGDVTMPTLILSGTKDEHDATARLCAERIRECYPMLVYDSGPAMTTERPAALYEAVADFLERGGRFVLERQDSTISP